MVAGIRKVTIVKHKQIKCLAEGLELALFAMCAVLAIRGSVDNTFLFSALAAPLLTRSAQIVSVVAGHERLSHLRLWH